MEGLYAGAYAPLGFRALMGAGCELVLAARPGLDKKKPLRVATSYPFQTIIGFEKSGYNLDLDGLDVWGGKIEGKMITDAYDAIVDLRSTGDTLRDNELVVYECFETIQTGIVYRKEPYYIRDLIFDEWRVYAESQTLQARKRQLDAGAIPDLSKKSTLALMSNGNKRRKNIGEESAELVTADAIGERSEIIAEASDMGYGVKVIAVANGVTPIRVQNEELSRNKNPELWLP